MSTFDLNTIFGVHGIVAVITGGGSGIGLYIANALDAAGAKAVYIIGRRLPPLEKAAQAAKNKSIIALQGDVTSKESLFSLASIVEKEQGYINVLFANSGILGVEAAKMGLGPKPTLKEWKDAMWKPSMEEFTNTFHVNVSGVFYTSLAFLELLDAGNKQGNLEQKSQIVITSSIAGFSRTIAAGVPYSTSKAATTHLVKMLATKLIEWKIRVNGIAPGLFQSEMTEGSKAFVGEDPTKEGGLRKEFCPLERTGREEEMAATALFLVGRGGGYMSGNVIVADGGRVGQLPCVY